MTGALAPFSYLVVLQHWYLVLESVQDLVKHILQVGVGVLPGGDGVAEEDEVVDDPAGVDADHLTHPPEGGVLLVVVANVP